MQCSEFESYHHIPRKQVLYLGKQIFEVSCLHTLILMMSVVITDKDKVNIKGKVVPVIF